MNHPKKSNTINFNGKILIFLFISFFSFQFVSAQKLKGNKIVTIEDREIASFHSIKVYGKLKVNLTPAKYSGVSVETDENLHTAISTIVHNGVLEISLGQKISRKKALNINVSVTDSLQHIEVRENAFIQSDKVIHTDELTVKTTDHGKISLSIDAYNVVVQGKDRSTIRLTVNTENELNLDLNGNNDTFIQGTSDTTNIELVDSSKVQISGSCNDISINATDSSDCKAREYLTQNATLTVSGRSDVAVNVENEVNIIASEKSEISIYANPQITLNEFSGKATLFKKEIK